MELKRVICILFLLIAACYDFRSKKVPWVFLCGGIITAIILQCLDKNQNAADKIISYLPGAVLITVSWITRESIGYADGLGILTTGILMGGRHCLFVICISLCLVSLTGIVLLILKKADRNTRIPYFPFLFGAEIFAAVLHFI